MNNKVMFFVINEEGIREDAQILAKYKLSNGNNYITYTYNEINDNNMIKIYSTGVVKEEDGYSYKEIVSSNEWDEIKTIMKDIARDPSEPLSDSYECDLKFEGEEVSVRRPKKLLVSKKFADTLASKYKEESEPKINTIPDLNVEAAVNTPAEFILGSETKESNEDLLNKTIEIPTFEELQARNKNIESVILNSKPENNVVPLEEFKMPEEKVEEKIEEPEAIKTNYKEKFKEEVEPLLLNVYEKQLKQIEELEEELSKTKFDLFEKQKETLSLKKEKEELENQGNALKEELDGVNKKMNGILSVLQGNNKD